MSVDSVLDRSIRAAKLTKKRKELETPTREELRGASAYQVWLSQGNSGTPTDFFNALKGDKGDKGDRGDKGDKGDRGDPGDRGADGVSVVSISEKFTQDGSLILYFHFSDGTTDMVTTGSLRGDKGDPGRDGIGIKTIKSKFNSDDSLTLTITLEDGKSYTVKSDSLRGAQGLNGVSGGRVDSVQAGTNINVDNTDPQNPIVSATDSGFGGLDIGDAIGNSPETNGILYVDSSGNLQNDQIQTQASSYFGGAVTGYELNSPDHTHPRFGFVNLSGIGQANALAFATNSSTPMSTFWIDTDTLTAYVQMYLDTATPANSRFSLGFHNGGLNSGNTFTVDGSEVDFKVLIDMNNNRITEVATPTAGTDAANKDYVDTEIASIPSGSPGGSDAQLQYNNGSSFGGAALYYDDTKSFANLGIGTSTPTSPLHITESPGDTTEAALRVELTSEYTGGSQQGAGRFRVYANDSASSAFSGLINIGETDGSDVSAGQLYGFQGEVIHGATTGTVGIASAGALRSSNTGGGTITANHGLVIYSALNSGGGDVTANYGLKIDSQTVGSNNYSIWTEDGVVAFAGSLPTNYNQWTGGGAGKGIGFSYRNNTEIAAFNGYASVVNFEPRVEASANNDLLIGTYFLPSFADNGYTGLTKVGTMFQSTDPTAIAFKLRAASGQTADILQVVNNSNAPIFSIGAIGAFQQQITSNETLVAFNSVVQSTYSGSSEQVNFFQSFQAANAASATFINSDILMRTAGAGALSASKMVGQRITSYQQGGSGTVGSLVGQEVIVRNLSGGTATVTNGIGLSVLSASNSSGTFTNNYGLKVENQSAATNNWAIHTGTGQVQFGDILKLSASSTSRATLNIPSGTAPTSPQDGDIWSDGSDIKVRLGGTTYTLNKT